MLERISENLSEAMQNKVAFRIPIFGGIPVPVSCVVTWIIMAILVIASILLTRNLKLIPDRKQMMLESFVGFLRDFFREQLGEKGMAYFPFLATVIIYIGFANIIGLLGFTPPTKDLNVTAGLAIMSIVLHDRSEERFSRNEHCACGGCRNKSKRNKGLAEKLCQTCGDNRSAECNGACYQTAVALYATFRKRACVLYHHGAYRRRLPDSDTAGILGIL